MAPRSSTGWPQWEEDNLLPWLEANSGMSWKDLVHAYQKQLGIDRSIESLRGKKYHILRKRERDRVTQSVSRRNSRSRSPRNSPRLKSPHKTSEKKWSSLVSTNSPHTIYYECVSSVETHESAWGNISFKLDGYVM
ncbi:hypothetical protein N7540_013002 [Penicillium herquei]|nr:hypothetical protein N7540_013002 [Penicillium herquei]